MISQMPSKLYTEDGQVLYVRACDIHYSAEAYCTIDCNCILHEYNSQKIRIVTNPNALIIEDDLAISLITGILEDAKTPTK